MKKFLVIALAAVVAISVGTELFAGQNNYGCGLGSIIFKGKDGLLSQTCAVTFNGTCANQTFGITTGTSNCEQFKGIVSNEKINKFVADNMDNLAKDIAKGNGEYLNTLAVLMEVKEPVRGQFYGKLQNNFGKIYTSEKITHVDVLNNIEKVMN
ncbi:MAG TPA: DUF3015 family protein [Spirochaetota bacterium]|nr:DUF3015 family protein [Spirochaetota bacterium]HNT10258.1 DUF3015 family protein [Spirochaetota bacterium]HNV48881.1 DUF3015 family protein [Spirochaetota bacterium]HOS41208.1 DUF3015 family protein [Spirochaetota bacterium]HPI22419.1 DUF3015 family protein [Spirochaetota bacterium]